MRVLRRLRKMKNKEKVRNKKKRVKLKKRRVSRTMISIRIKTKAVDLCEDD